MTVEKSDELSTFENQVAGHKGKSSMLVDPTGETILKPMDDVEFEFYEVIKQYAEIKSYFPKFFGRKVIEDETGVVSHYVQIENLTLQSGKSRDSR